MADERTYSEEHLRRLTLAARAAELVPTSPETDTSPIREGISGEVPLRLVLYENGTLEVRATTPRSLPEGFEARRHDIEGPQVQANNPAAALRLGAHAEVRKRLEALFEVAPRARIFEEAVRLELAPEVKDEQVQSVLRAALRAASALAQASEELALVAEQSRELVRSTASPALLEGGRRFVKLPPKKVRLDRHQRSRVILVAEQMLLRGTLHVLVRDYLSKEASNAEEVEELYHEAIENSEWGVKKRQFVTLLIVLPILGLSIWGLAHYEFFTGRIDVKIIVLIASMAAGTYAVWRRVGKLFDRREAQRTEDGLYRSIFTKRKD